MAKRDRFVFENLCYNYTQTLNFTDLALITKEQPQR